MRESFGARGAEDAPTLKAGLELFSTALFTETLANQMTAWTRFSHVLASVFCGVTDASPQPSAGSATAGSQTRRLMAWCGLWQRWCFWDQ